MTTTTTSTTTPSNPDTRAIFFFDIDNCLYPKSTHVHSAMSRLIQSFVSRHLSLSSSDAQLLHHKYYKDYGLAIEGLSRFHKISPLDFNREVDDALPLDDLLKPDPALRETLLKFDKTKVKMWLFTNAHVTHGLRVVRILGVEDLFEGITYCDYGKVPLVPKPKEEMFGKAEREAGVYYYHHHHHHHDNHDDDDDDGGKESGIKKRREVYFVDDSWLNCRESFKRGWKNTVHLVEPGTGGPGAPVSERVEEACRYRIESLSELPGLFPELIKDGER